MTSDSTGSSLFSVGPRTGDAPAPDSSGSALMSALGAASSASGASAGASGASGGSEGFGSFRPTAGPAPRPVGGSPPQGSSSRGAPGFLCVFRAAGGTYALDVAHVRQVVAMPPLRRVPAAHPAVMGVANLRGTILTVLDPAPVLGVGDDSEPTGPAAGSPGSVLVAQIGGLLFGLAIRRAEGVFRFRPESVRRLAGSGEHPAVDGLVEPEGRAGLVAAVLRPEVLAERLAALRAAGRGRSGPAAYSS
jgi:chemotaxis signal transduction protein